MRRKTTVACLTVFTLGVAGCQRNAPAEVQAASVQPVAAPPVQGQRKQIHATGLVQATRFTTIQVPQTFGEGGRMTLVRLIPNGATVKQGDLVAEFDRTKQIDDARAAQAKFEDLGHQVEQKSAQNRSDSEKRQQDLTKAEADLAKARIELRKGPLLSEIDRMKNEAKARDAEAHVASLKKSMHSHDVAEAAALRILELQRDRQKLNWDRMLKNAEKLQLRAPLPGMVALENVWKQGSIGHAQEGDQLWSGQQLLRIFDPSEMQVLTQVAEPDGAALVQGAKAKVRLDAYPELIFDAHFETASPVAAAPLGSPIKTFAARFRLDARDPHLLPDMSAAVIVLPPGGSQ